MWLCGDNKEWNTTILSDKCQRAKDKCTVPEHAFICTGMIWNLHFQAVSSVRTRGSRLWMSVSIRVLVNTIIVWVVPYYLQTCACCIWLQQLKLFGVTCTMAALRGKSVAWNFDQNKICGIKLAEIPAQCLTTCIYRTRSNQRRWTANTPASHYLLALFSL